MTTLLVTNNYPPGRGGVSRYYEGLVKAADGRVHVAGVDTPEGFPPPDGTARPSRGGEAGAIYL